MTETKKYNSYEEIENKLYIPSFQRDINRNVVNEIKEYIKSRLEKNLDLTIGVIDLCKFNAQLFCIDGQHRIKALEELYIETKKDIPFHCIIYTISTKEEMEEIFKLRNYNIPVPHFIMFPPTGKQELIREINKFMWDDLPLIKMPRSGSKIYRPYIDLNRFMEYLTDSELLNQCEKIEDFITIFWKINEKIRRNKNKEEFKKNHNISNKMLETIKDKCSDYDKNLFIGLYTDYSKFDDLL
jgi:hypothetical protein